MTALSIALIVCGLTLVCGSVIFVLIVGRERSSSQSASKKAWSAWIITYEPRKERGEFSRMNQRPPRTFKTIICTEISSIRSATARPTPQRAGGGDHRDRRGGRSPCGRDRSLKGRQHKRGAEER
jgi:hypothetical protein